MLVLLAACDSDSQTDEHSAVTTGPGWGEEIGIGVDVITRPHTYLGGVPEREHPFVGWDVDVHRVGGVPVLSATLFSGFVFESFPTDSQWDVVAWGTTDTPLANLAIGDWQDRPVAMTDSVSSMYTLALVSGYISPGPGYLQGTTPGQLRTISLDDDGIDDLLLSVGSNTVLALRGPSPSGRWTETVLSVEGDPTALNFGYFLGEPGDLTGDGIRDLTFYEENDPIGGVVWILPGDRLSPGRENLVAEIGIAIRGIEPNAQVGGSIAVGDVTGDGVDDLVAGAFLAADRGGVTYVYPGPILADGTFADSIASITSLNPREWCGAHVEVVQDQNRDGYDEVVVACAGDRYFASASGRVEVYSGASLLGPMDANDAALVLHGNNQRSASPVDFFGYDIVADEDLTGDGLQDLVIGVPNEWRDDRPGGVYIVHSPLFE